MIRLGASRIAPRRRKLADCGGTAASQARIDP